jgi:uncharacterized membrane-anchored protein
MFPAPPVAAAQRLRFGLCQNAFGQPEHLYQVKRGGVFMHPLLVRLGALALFLACGAASAQPMTAEAKAKVWADAQAAATVGPANIPLAGQAVLKLPVDRVFIAEPHATRLLNAMGNPGQDSRLQGLVFPQDERQDWFVTVEYEASGYVKDDDAKNWNADDLLKSFREGTEQSNEEREKMGVRPLEIVGWAEKPAYDASSHRLVWAMSSRERGAPANAEQGVNYNTYALGREGYFTLNLVTALPALAAEKQIATELLAGLEYNSGKRYADFNQSTDKVAAYGLAALVLGVAAKKAGLLAVVLLFLAKFAKVIFIAVAAFGGVFFKFFKRKPKAESVADQQTEVLDRDDDATMPAPLDARPGAKPPQG